MVQAIMQVAEYTLQELLSTRWPTGEAVLTAEQALTAVAPHVDLVILDVKFSNPDRVGPASQLLPAAPPEQLPPHWPSNLQAAELAACSAAAACTHEIEYQVSCTSKAPPKPC